MAEKELKCSACRLYKPQSEYWKAKNFKRGRGYNCKSCIQKYKKTSTPGKGTQITDEELEAQLAKNLTKDVRCKSCGKEGTIIVAPGERIKYWCDTCLKKRVELVKKGKL